MSDDEKKEVRHQMLEEVLRAIWDDEMPSGWKCRAEDAIKRRVHP